MLGVNSYFDAAKMFRVFNWKYLKEDLAKINPLFINRAAKIIFLFVALLMEYYYRYV